MLIATAFIKNKDEISNCVSNLINEKDITISFSDEDVFVDKVDDMRSDILLQKVKGVSSFTSEDNKYLNGISMKMDPIRLKHTLNMFDKNEPFTIFIFKTACKFVQLNCSSTFPIMELAKFEDMIYHTRKMENKMDSEHLTNTSVLKVHMKEIAILFKKMSRAESNGKAYEKLFPFYTLNFDEKNSSIGKGDVNSHFFSIQLMDFDFSGEPVKVQVSNKVEKAKNIFNRDKYVTIKYHHGSVIHFTQDLSPTLKIDFLLGTMTK